MFRENIDKNAQSKLASADGGPAQRKSIQSVEIGTRVLIALMDRDGGEAHLRDVAERSNLSRSQAHRYLLAFVNGGLVEQNPASGKYSLGSLAVRIGLAAMAKLDPIRVTGEQLDALLKELKTTGLMSVWGTYGPTIIRWLDGGIPLFASFHVGSILPLQTSSTGLLYLTYCPDAHTKEHLAWERANGVYVDDEELKTKTEKVRRDGFASTFGTVVQGLSAISVPVIDSQNRMVATMSALARTQDNKFFSEKTINRIKEQGRQASIAIGWSEGA
ncbi:IclR family transcriptional regulator [Novosphingobium sp. Gsoil 351]|uniref:IclR family transcriptional regulator n=1 Tax=Novosphingobium sp. Gsoil 351 TaxID=2675225 RepID=UPI0012B4E60F|nr:IclR family transcriptional regulator [Novosphingobium sp. Gsoil 351]QGN54000.1 helix-turn-helix domain-containing protein [Novosphingobium sp. Gsoil 351]